MTNKKLDKNILEIAKKLNENGGRLYLVGGAIRDELLNIPTNDFDFCVTGVSFVKFQKLFPESKIIGKDFPVFLLDSHEFALARTERKVAAGYKGFEITSNENISIEDDLKRRDITINAIAKDVLTGKIIDPFNGINDLKSKVIKHVSKAFIEDPLRAYRAARFAAKFNFNISPDTLILMHSLKPELHTLSKERVFLEMKKALLTHTPSVFFKTLRQADILDVHFEEIYNLINVPQPIKYHPEGDVFNHTMIVLDKVSKESKNVETRFCALTHDLGKGVTPKDILPRHINHEVYGLNEIKNFCDRLKTPNSWKKKALATCKYHMKAGICQNMRPYKLAKFINDVNKSAISLEDLNIISNADDMLNREKLQFSTLGREMLKNVNGNTLKESGITIDSVGIEKYNHILLEKQAQFLSNQF